MKLIETMNQNNYTSSSKTRYDFSKDLLITQEFDELIIRDLDDYVTYANSIFKKGELTIENRG